MSIVKRNNSIGYTLLRKNPTNSQNWENDTGILDNTCVEILEEKNDFLLVKGINKNRNIIKGWIKQKNIKITIVKNHRSNINHTLLRENPSNSFDWIKDGKVNNNEVCNIIKFDKINNFFFIETLNSNGQQIEGWIRTINVLFIPYDRSLLNKTSHGYQTPPAAQQHQPTTVAQRHQTPSSSQQHQQTPVAQQHQTPSSSQQHQQTPVAQQHHQTITILPHGLPPLYVNNTQKWTHYPPGTILFYERADKKTYFLTNFYAATVKVNGIVWKTSEHFFQAQKFIGNQHLMNLVRKKDTPLQAFKLTRDYPTDVNPNWANYKDSAMLIAVRAKFTQHKHLHSALMATNNNVLVEHTTNDVYWGDGGGSGQGYNVLGQILMQVRSEIKNKIIYHNMNFSFY